ncbi:hypothetical protein SeMB42_g04517 [Synchytrium endobioticum]|uniref:protein-serine/threonine phosphatase n=1 Tax=Synchytrium endobioticum TaxID=286115 RepID=A0A507D2B3_9FUNG|nr:hypothetical protein SeMB42_g04517 [Synchytrium endobioticum]TPX45606.1 hypothetical protein SeLEV6574_g03773 [Synchytrium endobioticum]
MSGNEDDSPQGVITQVRPPSPSTPSAAASLITQVRPPDETSSLQQPLSARRGDMGIPLAKIGGAAATENGTLPKSSSNSHSSSASTTSKKRPRKGLLGALACILPCLSLDDASDGVDSQDGKRGTHSGIAKAGDAKMALRIKPAVSTQPPNSKLAKPEPSPTEKRWLLPPLAPEDVGKKCLVLDLDETLVHSSFKAVHSADFVIPVEIDAQIHNVYVLKRPSVDYFMKRLGSQFEIVVFTASLAKYADPVLDMLDRHKTVKHRLFREACLHHRGNYVKDLSQLGRDLKDVIILDNSPASYIFHPTNAIPISSWFNDVNDTELRDLVPYLEDLKWVPDVTKVLDNTMEDA